MIMILHKDYVIMKIPYLKSDFFTSRLVLLALLGPSNFVFNEIW